MVNIISVIRHYGRGAAFTGDLRSNVVVEVPGEVEDQIADAIKSCGSVAALTFLRARGYAASTGVFKFASSSSIENSLAVVTLTPNSLRRSVGY